MLMFKEKSIKICLFQLFQPLDRLPKLLLKLRSTRSATTPPIGLAKKRENGLSETQYTVCLQQRKSLTTFKALL